MLRPVIVPLDGSSFSERAIPVAISIAKRNKLRVDLVAVHEPFIPPPARAPAVPLVNPVMDSEWRSRRGAYVRDIAARFHTPTVPVSGSVMDGPVAAGIVEHAANERATLIVLATHGDAAKGRLWLASIPRALTHLADIPVLLVKPESSLEPGQAFSRILIPLDGSQISETAIDNARMIGGKTGVEYVLLRVVTRVEEWEFGVDSWGAEENAAVLEAKKYLQKHARRLRAAGLDVSYEVIRSSRPAAAIIEYARKGAIDLIAITTQSRSVASRLIRRSMTDRVARDPNVAALVARAQESTVVSPAVVQRTKIVRGRVVVA